MASAPVISVIMLAAMLLFPQAASTAADSGARGLRELLATGIAIAGKAADAIVNLIRRAGSVSPVAALGGILVACAAVPIARSEYEVTRRSLQLVWTDEIASDRVALSLVLMVFAVGLLMHVFDSRALRLVVGCVALSLTIMSATLAYHRTVELDKIRFATEPMVHAASDSGELTIGGRAEELKPPGPKAAEVPSRLPAVLAGLLAFLLSLGGIIVGFGAFSLAGAAFVALLAFPALVFVLLLSAFARLADIAIAAIARATPSFIEACRERWVRVLRYVRTLLPADWTAEGDAWRRARASRAAEFERLVRERADAVHRAQSARSLEDNRLQRHREFLQRQQELDIRSMSDAFDASRQLVAETHLSGVRELLDTVARKRREFFNGAVRDAFAGLRARVAEAPLQLVALLLWPLDRVWRIMGEDHGLESLRPQTQSAAPAAAAPSSTKEGSAQ